MRYHIDKFVMLPFSVGCDSKLDVAAASSSSHAKKKKNSLASAFSEAKERQEGEEGAASGERKRNIWGFLVIPKATRLKFIRSLKSLSQVFVYKEEIEEEEEEKEMEIGYPTDVKHVTHIGWDGSTTINPIKGWENLKAPEIVSFPSTISIKQFELAMAAQASGEHQPKCVNTSNIASS